MAKILLTHSYFLRLDKKQWKRAQPYPPLGTLYAASTLLNEGHEVRVFDTMFARTPTAIKPILTEFAPDIICVYDDGFNYLTKMCLTNMREAAFEMGRLARESGATTAVCSSDSTDRTPEYLDNGFDFVIRGEGETTLAALCREVMLCKQSGTDKQIEAGKQIETGRETEASRQPSSVEGLSFKTADGSVRTNRDRAAKTALDDLPAPVWQAIDLEPYRAMWSKHGRFSLNMVTTRGCPYRCNWCAKPIYGNRYNSHSPEAKAEELELLRNEHGAQHIWFCDDIFGLRRGWVQSFAEEVERRGVRTPFTIQSRADLLIKDDTVEALARAGCERAWIGAESGSQKILDAMDKGITVEQIHSAREKLRQYGIQAAFFLQFGYLGETQDDIDATLQMLFELEPDDIGISISYPLPGTPFYDKVKAELKQKANWSDSDDLALMFQNQQSPSYYRALHRWVHQLYRRHQYRRALQQGIGPGHHPEQRSRMRNTLSLAYFSAAELVSRTRLRRAA